MHVTAQKTRADCSSCLCIKAKLVQATSVPSLLCNGICFLLAASLEKVDTTNGSWQVVALLTAHSRCQSDAHSPISILQLRWSDFALQQDLIRKVC